MATFFLEGERFVGKTTLLRRLILEHHLTVTGLFVQRLFTEDGQILGFELREAESIKNPLEKNIFCKKNVFLLKENGKMSLDDSVFKNFGVDLLHKAQESTDLVVLLDEIGGSELNLTAFTKELETILKSDKKIIGVFKSDENYKSQKNHSQYSLEVTKERKKIKNMILANGYLETLTEDNQQEIYKRMQEFLR